MGAGNLAPPGFDPRTVQPVAGRYTDYAKPAQQQNTWLEVKTLKEVLQHSEHLSV
jgi:hypothetical protein